MRAPRSSHLQTVKEDFSIRAALKKALPFIWPRTEGKWMKLRVLGAIFLLLLARLLDLTKPVALKWTIDALSAENPVLPMKLILLYAFVGFGVTFVDDLRGILFAKVAAELERKIALETFTHLQNLSLRFHLSKKSGSILRSVSRGASSFASVMRIVLFQFFSICFQVIIVLTYLLVDYDWPYASVTMGVIMIYAIYAYYSTEYRDKLRREMNAKDNEFNQKAVDALLNFETVKYFNSESHEAERYDAALKDYRAANIKTQKAQSWISIGQQTFLGAGVAAVMILGGKEVVAGTMTVGSFLLVQQFILTLYKPLGDLGRIYRQIKNNLVDVEAMFDLFSETPEIVDSTSKELSCEQGTVEFKNVCFGYDSNREILKDVSFKIAPGESVAIVGPSGTGKSTIARLLYRFYDINSGSILIDNQDIRDVTQLSLRRNIGIVPQDCALFNDSIGYNIGYGIYGRRAEGPTQRDIENAAEQAQIDKFIMSQEAGYDLHVGERGLRISGGEKQRVAIARAILKDSKIMIFDEATSSLDTHTEQEIIKEMDTLSKGRSSLTIAHRLSTIVNSDKIIVLRKGEIVESGVHSELLAKNGEYKEMWDRQAQKDELQNAMEKLQTPFMEHRKKSRSRRENISETDFKSLSFDEDQEIAGEVNSPTSSGSGSGSDVAGIHITEQVDGDSEEEEFDDTMPLLEMQRMREKRGENRKNGGNFVIDIKSLR